jgi:hypothetical protein
MRTKANSQRSVGTVGDGTDMFNLTFLFFKNEMDSNSQLLIGTFNTDTEENADLETVLRIRVIKKMAAMIISLRVTAWVVLVTPSSHQQCIRIIRINHKTLIAKG